MFFIEIYSSPYSHSLPAYTKVQTFTLHFSQVFVKPLLVMLPQAASLERTRVFDRRGYSWRPNIYLNLAYFSGLSQANFHPFYRCYRQVKFTYLCLHE